MKHSDNICATIKIDTTEGQIRVYISDLDWPQLALRVTHGTRAIFGWGQLYCSTNGRYSSDSVQSKEWALATVAMTPGDTDSDYFADYTPEQLAWANAYTDAITMARDSRYCDPETGECDGRERRGGNPVRRYVVRVDSGSDARMFVLRTRRSPYEAAMARSAALFGYVVTPSHVRIVGPDTYETYGTRNGIQDSFFPLTWRKRSMGQTTTQTP